MTDKHYCDCCDTTVIHYDIVETVKAKLAKSDVANAEIARLTAWLDNHNATYDEYDDVVIRRVVDCIKAVKDGTITVLTKFGTSAIETV